MLINLPKTLGGGGAGGGGLAATELQGLVMDFTKTSEFNKDVWSQNWNQRRASSVDTFGSPYTFYSNGSTTPKMVRTSANGIGWSVHNLQRQSQTFDNAGWGQKEATITADVTLAPDGTKTADLMTATAGSGTHGIWGNGISVPYANALQYTISLYVKDVSARWINLGMYASANRYACAIYDLTNVTATFLSNTNDFNIGQSITSVGGGWYRITMSYLCTFANGNFFCIQICNSGSPTVTNAGNAPFTDVYTATGSEAVYVWGAHVTRRDGNSLPIYIPTTSAAVCAAPVSYGEGLWIEPASSNLVLRTAELNNAAWTKTGWTVVQDSTAAPDGTVSAEKLTSDVSGILQSSTMTVTASTIYTVSFFFKYFDTQWLRFEYSDSGATDRVRVWFDILNGVRGTTAGVGAGTYTTSSIIPIGNGWYRASVSGTIGTQTLAALIVSTATADNSLTKSATSFYAWGAQLEPGRFASSHIPNAGLALVTRPVDNVRVAGSVMSSLPFIGPAYTLYGKADVVELVASGGGLLALNDNTANNRADIRIPQNTGTHQSFVTSAGSGVATFDYAIATLGANKIALAVEANNFAGCANNGTVLTDSTGAVPINPTQLLLGQIDTTATSMRGFIKEIRVYNRRLSNAELGVLTT